MEIVSAALFVPALMLLFYFALRDFGKELKIRGAKGEMFWLILSLPVLIALAILVTRKNIPDWGLPAEQIRIVFSIVVAALISFFWILYLTWLDIYEREKKRYLLLVFVLGCAFTYWVFPLSDWINGLGFNLNGEGWNDFAYCVIGIGMVEELVKFIPWFLLWRFSHQINEPFDFILYASISALGFAFVENILYLNASDLTAVYARALYSSVAHMFFSSIMAYGWIWRIHRGLQPDFGLFLLLWLLASLGHGFYDFWFIHNELNLEVLTLVFFLLNLHVWVLMKNNLINISGFYNPALKLNSHIFLYRLVNLLLLVLIVALVGFNMLFGQGATASFGWHILNQYSYVFVYITVSFSSFQVIPGYIGSYRLPTNAFKLLLPKIIRYPDFTGYSIYMDHRAQKVYGTKNVLGAMAGAELVLKKRLVLDGLPNAYALEWEDHTYLVQFIKEHPREDGVWQLMVLRSKHPGFENQSYFRRTELSPLGKILVRLKQGDK